MGSSQRRRRTRSRRRNAPEGASEATAPSRRRSGWRQKLDEFGGLWTVAIATAIVVLIVAVLFNVAGGAFEQSDDPLLGEEIAIGRATHVETLAEMEIPVGQPPVGGPHFSVWLEPGFFEEQVSDGNAVHSLEHGLIWFTYNPAVATADDIATLQAVFDEFSNDVIVSPRPANEAAVTAASWGRLLTLDSADEELLSEFVETNRNRSPEPGVRGNGVMPLGSDER